MQRSSHHLDPKLTPERAISTLQAAKLYLIDGLSAHCLRYLMGLRTPEMLIRTMNVALKASHTVPEEVIIKCCRDMVLHSRELISSDYFIQAHGFFISQMIQLDELELEEEVLWSRLLQWSSNAVQNPELLGPFADAIGEKCPMVDSGLGSNELAQQAAIVQMLSKHMRFAAMSKEFFFDKVRPWLPREDSDAVISCLWLGRQVAEVHASKRAGLETEVAHGLKVVQCNPDVETEAIQNLLTGSSWNPPFIFSMLRVSHDSLQLREITKVELTFSEGSLWNCRLCCSCYYCLPSSTQGRVQIFTPFCARHWHSTEWYIVLLGDGDILPANPASLTKVIVCQAKSGASLDSTAERLYSNFSGSLQLQ